MPACLLIEVGKIICNLGLREGTGLGRISEVGSDVTVMDSTPQKLLPQFEQVNPFL